MAERVILAPNNDAVCKINEKIFDMFEAQQETDLSIDSVVDHDQATDFPVEFLIH